jgi:D-serine dehydratase
MLRVELMQRNGNLGFHVKRKRLVRQLERKDISRDRKALVTHLPCK